ncbi:hypothetical protein OC845_001444 [Tilletia horrida]|nr:hypothetical protein OC845_001444 [Tilletia horrida]
MSASALQRAASVIGSSVGASRGSGEGGAGGPGAQSSALSRSASVRTPSTYNAATASSNSSYGGPGANAGSGGNAGGSGPHSLSLKVMRISAPSLVRAQDRSYFEVPDESVPPHPTPSVHAKSRARAGALAQDISSAEAGESQRLYAALAQDDNGRSQSHIGAAERALRSAAGADMISNQSLMDMSSALDPSQATSALIRDWPTSDVLVLPSSFGTIHLGEAFKAYICLNNESTEPVKDATLHVEIQQLDKDESSSSEGGPTSGDPPPSHNPSIVLARLSTARPPTQSGDGQSKEAASKQDGNGLGADSTQSLLQPQGKLETTVRHDMRKPGGYVLGCTVSYQAWLPAPRLTNYDGSSQGTNQGQWVERSFRKSYRFSVPTCPLTVRSKAHAHSTSSILPSQRSSANLAYTSDPNLRDSVLLEVQVRNDCPHALVLERAWLDSDLRSLGLHQAQTQDAFTLGLAPPFSGWKWESIDRPWLNSTSTEQRESPDPKPTMSTNHFGFSSTSDNNAAGEEVGLWEDEEQWLLPEDVRQFIFRLTPVLPDVSSSAAPLAIKYLRDLYPPSAIMAASGIAGPLPAVSSLNRNAFLFPSSSMTLSPPPSTNKTLPATPNSRMSVVGNHPAPAGPSSFQHPSNQHALSLSGGTFPVMVPLGKLDIAWRMAGPGGEPGRLQTSMLFWKRDIREPVAIARALAPAYAWGRSGPPSQVSPTPSNFPTGPQGYKPYQPYLHAHQQLQLQQSLGIQPGSGPGPTPADGSTPAVNVSAVPPIIEVELSVAPLEHAQHLIVGEPFQLDFELWIRDLSCISSPQTARGANASVIHEDGDDSDDDDTPLSEVGRRRLSRVSSATSTPTESTVAAAASTVSPAGTKPAGRILKLGVRYIQPGEVYFNALDGQDHLTSANAKQVLNPNIDATEKNSTSANSTASGTNRGSGLLAMAFAAARGGTPTPSTSSSRTAVDEGLPAKDDASSHGALPYQIRSSIDSVRSTASTVASSAATYARRGTAPVRNNSSAVPAAVSSLQGSSGSPSSSRTGSPTPYRRSMPVSARLASLATQGSGGEGSSSPTMVGGPGVSDSNLPHLTSPAQFGMVPSAEVYKLGCSDETLRPVRIERATTAGPLSPTAVSATISFQANYLASGPGSHRVGGLRVMLLGWEDVEDSESSPDTKEDQGENQTADRTTPSRTVTLERPIPLRQIDILADVWVQERS